MTWCEYIYTELSVFEANQRNNLSKMTFFIFKRAVSLNTGTSGPMISHHGGSVRASKEHDDDSLFMNHKLLFSEKRFYFCFRGICHLKPDRTLPTVM